MKFGYAVVYVPDVEESLIFFEKAFGFSRCFLHKSGKYGELNTGETKLAFVSQDLGEDHFPEGFIASYDSEKPLGMEIAFVTSNVIKAYERALNEGATALKLPEAKPWGQIMSSVRCPDGVVVEICSERN